MVFQLAPTDYNAGIRHALQRGDITDAVRLADRLLRNQLLTYPIGEEYAESYMLITAAYAKKHYYREGPVEGFFQSCQGPRRDELTKEYSQLVFGDPMRVDATMLHLDIPESWLARLIHRVKQMF